MNNSKKILVVSHCDLDGYLSGIIAEKYINARNDLPCTVVFTNYGRAIEDIIKVGTKLEDYDLIYVLDISDDELFEKYHSKIYWLDHHKTAIEKYNGMKFKGGYCIDGVAACRLAFQYFTDLNYPMFTVGDYINRKVTEPLFVALAGEYDIFDSISTHSKALNFGVRKDYILIKNIFQYTLTIFADNFIKGKERQQDMPGILWECISKGYGAIDYIKEASNRLDGGIPITLFGHSGRMFNTDSRSKLVYDGEEDFTMVWQITNDMDRVTVSMYSSKIDVGDIAKQFNGGGHKGAAGFTTRFETIKDISNGMWAIQKRKDDNLYVER